LVELAQQETLELVDPELVDQELVDQPNLP
jgi:hypothetical protein